jgi:RecJ-like exonuclease
MRTLGRTAVAVALCLCLVGCRETTINKLLAEPNRYQGEEVGLKGQVIKSASILGTGAYQLDDGTGTIWVVSKHGVPRQGARVAVKGEVKDVVDIGGVISLPTEVGSGLVLVESEHRAR